MEALNFLRMWNLYRWVLKLKNWNHTVVNTPSNCHTCQKDTSKHFHVSFLPPPMAIVDRLTKNPTPQHTTEKKLSSEVVAIFLNLAVCRLDISWNRRRCCQMSRGFLGKSFYVLKCLLKFWWLQGNMSWFDFVLVRISEVFNLSYTKKSRCFGLFCYVSSQVPKHERYICHSFVACRRIYECQGIIQYDKI